MKISPATPRVIISLLLLLFLIGTLMAPDVSALPAGFQEFYLPLPTGNVGGGGTYSIFNAIEPPINAGNGMHYVVGVTASADNTTVYYDHWENGYSTGATGDQVVHLNKGQVYSFESSNIPVPRGTSTKYDGGDRIYVAGSLLQLVVSTWTEDQGTVFTDAWEVYPVKAWETSYTIPVGENLALAPPTGLNYKDFTYVYALVMSSTDGNNVQITDPGGAGLTTTLNRGQTAIYEVKGAGTTVTAGNPVQVQLMTGRRDTSGWEMRGYTITPRAYWGTEYYAPAPSWPSKSAYSNLYLYNPNSFAITINFEDLSGSGSFTIPAGKIKSYRDGTGRYIPGNSGAYVQSSNVFWGIAAGDTGSATWDWGYDLIPTNFLGTDNYVSWAPGTRDRSANGSPVYVTALNDNTTVFVDYGPNDGIFEATYRLNRLQSIEIYDPDKDNTGMHIVSTATVAVAWGESPKTAGTGDPYLDMGYTTLPLPIEWIEVALQVNKTVNPTQVNIGGEAEFTIVISVPSGAANATNVNLVDKLPPGWKYLLSSGSPSDPTSITGNLTSGYTLTWSSNWTINQGSSQTISFRAQATSSADTANPNRNLATATGQSAGTTLSADDDAFIDVPPSAGLSITKSDSSDPVLAGTNLTYTLVVSNAGPSDAQNVVVTDVLPSGVTYVGDTDSCVQSPAGTLTCNLGTVRATSSPSFIVTVTVPSTMTGTITNTATVTSTTFDPTPGNNTDSEDTTIKVVADLGISKVSEPAPAQPGRVLTYTLVVTNAGPGVVSGATVSDTLPTKLSGASWSCTASTGSSCTASGSDNINDTVTLLPGGRITYTITGTLVADAVATVVNTTTVTVPSGTTDPVPGNNSDTDSNTPELTVLWGVVTDQATGVPIVGATVVVTDSLSHTYTTTTGAGGVYTFTSTITNPLATGPATVTATATDYAPDTKTPTLEPGTNRQDLQLGTVDLLVSKTDGQTTVSPGDILTYTVTINNIGSIIATNVVITDVLPNYTTYVTDTTGVVPTVTPPYTYVWALGNLAARTGITFELSVRVAISLPNGTTNLDNYVVASTHSPEADITDNEFQDTDQVTAQPNLTLFKSATADSVPVSARSLVTYTYQGENRGNAIASGVVITDLLDANTTYISDTAELVVGGVQQPLVVTYTDATDTLLFGLPDIMPGASGFLTYTVQVTNTLPGETQAITNTATVGLNETDTDYSNNSDQAVLPAKAGVNLVIDKLMTADPSPAEPGGYLHITHLRVENLGSSMGTGIIVTDVVPANTTYVSNTIYLDGGHLTDYVGDDAGSYISATPMISVSLGSVVSGTISVISFTVQINDPLPAGVTSITNTAYISGDQTDLIPGDNQDTAVVGVSGQPDLVIVKSDGLTDVLVGETITYTLIYSNVGNIGVTGVVITDTVLENLTNVVPGGGGIYDPASGIITWTISTLQVDGPHTLTVTATVSQTALEGQLVANRAQITDDGTNGADADLSNNSSLDIDVIHSPYLVLEKQASSPAYVGGTITYTISYQNLKRETAYNVVITDAIPANTTYVPDSCTPACTVAGGVITWTEANVAPSVTGTVSFVVTVTESAGGDLRTAPTLHAETASGSVVITSSVSTISRPWCDFPSCNRLKVYYGGSDPVGPSGWQDNPRLQGTSFDDSSWQDPLAPVPEVYWTEAAHLSAGWVSYTDTDKFDPNYSFYRQSFCLPLNAGGLNATLQIASDDVGEFSLNGTASGTHRGGGSAETFVVSSGLQSGANLLAVRLLNNNHGGHDFKHGGDMPGLIYNLSTSYGRLWPFVYATVVVLNGQPATFAVDEIALGGRRPYSYTYEFGDSTTQAYTTTSTITHTYTGPGVYTATVTTRCKLGCTGVDQIVITVLPAGTNMLANRAVVGYENELGRAYSGESGAGVALKTLVDLQITKADWPDQVVAGETLTYTLTYTNSGPSTAQDVYITDTLPSGLNFDSMVSIKPPLFGPTQTAQTLTWYTPTVAAGVTGTIVFRVAVDAAVSGTTTNNVVITSSIIDSYPGNNQAAEPTQVETQADVKVGKSGNPDTVIAGTTLTYTLVVSNAGPSDAQNVVVTDVLPSGVTYVGDTNSCLQSTAGALTCSLGTVTATNSSSFIVTVTVGSDISGTITNTVTMTSTTYDPTPGNNSDDETTTVQTQALGTVSGTVFDDLNGNVIQDPGEPGIGVVTIQLLDSDGNVVATTTTAGDGSYIFTGVIPGDYTVQETDPAGFTSTTPNSVPVTVPPGGAGSANFGDQMAPPPMMLEAEKTDGLFLDGDGNGIPSPGDTLLYEVIIVNSGNAAVTGVTFNDSPDPNTTLVVGSVQTSEGTVTRGNNPGDTTVAVDIGIIAGGGASVTISFQVTISDPLPYRVTQVANQGIISSNELTDEPTDDPDTGPDDDPTVTPVTVPPPTPIGGYIAPVSKIELLTPWIGLASLMAMIFLSTMLVRKRKS